MARPIKYETDVARKEAIRVTQRLAQARFRKRNPNYRSKFPDSHKRYIENNRLKVNARTAVSRAVKRGIITVPKNCENCDAESKLEADHADYNKQLEVQWLCKPCHQETTNERRNLLVV